MNQPETRIGDLCAEPGVTLWMRRSIRPKQGRAAGDDGAKGLIAVTVFAR